jgi:hypothetical protein
MMEKHGVEEFCFFKLVIIPKTIILSAPGFGSVEAPLFDTQKEGGISIILFLEERCGDGERKSFRCEGKCITELVFVGNKAGG